MATDLNATVSLSQIAELIGVRPSAVSNWRKRFDDFPRPIRSAAGGRDLFSLAEVEAWLRTHKPEHLREKASAERLLFLAADRLRGSAPADEGLEIFASAITLLEAADRVGISLDSDLVDAIAQIELQEPRLANAFNALIGLDRRHALDLLALAREIAPQQRPELFDWVLGRRRRFVETRTSQQLAQLLAEVSFTSDRPGRDRVLDPAAGEGGTLAAIAVEFQPRSLYGQELNLRASRIAQQRFFLRRLDVELQQGDSLLDDRFPKLQVDVVICDPPYGAKLPSEWGYWSHPARLSFGAAKTRSADFAWIEYAINHLADDGRGYLLLPAGTLFRRGREAEVRAELIRRGAVEAIVGLPAGTAQHTKIPLALWIVQQPQQTAERPVLLIDYAAGASGGSLNEDRVQEIALLLERWRESGEVASEDRDVATQVSPLELLGADANLQPSRWMPPLSVERPAELNIASAFARVADAVAAIAEAPTTPAPSDVPDHRQWISVRDLAETEVATVIRGVRVSNDDCQAAGVRVLRTRDISETIRADEPCYLVTEEMKQRPTLTRAGDVILSPASGRLRAVVDAEGEYIIASPLQALRLDPRWMDPHVAAAFLESPRNRRFAHGVETGYARVDIRDLELPVLSAHEVQHLRATLEQLRQTERQAHELAERARAAREAILGSVGQAGSGS